MKLKLTELREARGWSRAELARHAGMHASDVGKIELGRMAPYPVQLLKLAKALGAEAIDLMGLDDEGEK